MDSLKFRQIHLDFHTSPDIEGIGAAFDPEEFADTLAKAHVNSVTAFGRCHHGFIYYDTKTNPERLHPHLSNVNLLKEQIEACHARNIKVPIYLTVQWDEYTTNEHRDWLCIDEDGQIRNYKPQEAGFYQFLDVFHPGFRQFLKSQTRDVFDCLPVDGLFFDIVQPQYSMAKHWLDAMDDRGFNPEDEEARKAFSRIIINEWKLEMTGFIRSLADEYPDAKDCTIFYNAGHVGPRHRASYDAYSHYELESLPSGGWGYTHFPLAMRYARGLGKQSLAMTGKFHTTWGDFHSYKNQVALDYECFNALSLGAKCSVGDQLLPNGTLDAATYELIGATYASVEEKEPWCDHVEPIVDIGVLTPEEFAGRASTFAASPEKQPDSAIGFVRMLQELHLQFDILDSESNFSKYKLLVLPDRIPANEALVKKLEAYLAAGGKLISTYASMVNDDATAIELDGLGVEYVGKAPYSPDFIVPGEEVFAGLKPTGYVMYNEGVELRPANGSKVLAQVETPYFNRTWRQFCGHNHAPSNGQVGYPGMIENEAGTCITFAHPIFKQYHDNAPLWCKLLFKNAVDRLLPDESKAVAVDGPSTLLVNANRQPNENRQILHLLHYIPERRGVTFDVIEETLPVYDIGISLEAERVSTVQIVPSGEDLPFEQVNGRVNFKVPKVDGHVMVCVTE